jgi:hypothetical protein
MASGYVNRINRPNTWPHRPMLNYVKILLANSEPMVWTPPTRPGRMSDVDCSEEDHHADRSNWFGFGKVRV